MNELLFPQLSSCERGTDEQNAVDASDYSDVEVEVLSEGEYEQYA